jgi:uncharacterized damage-inducible protein DinB
MNSIEYIQREIGTVRVYIDAVLQGTTDGQLNWNPPGTTNSIKATLLHLIASEDSYVQHILQGKTRLWEAENWGAKIGLATVPGRSAGWEEIKGVHLTLAPIMDYLRAVRAETDAYLAALTPEELDRPVEFMGRQQLASDPLIMLVVHSVGHAGEIAALKGMQGVKGLPF